MHYKFFLFLLPLFCFSRTIYVAKNGDDSNDGSLENPYLTITKAANEAVAGDIVYIREGVYEETLTPLNSGEEGKLIVFQSFPNEKVIISAMQELSGWVDEGGGIFSTTIHFNSLGQENFVMNKQTALNYARWPNKTSINPFDLETVRNTGGSDGNTVNGSFLTMNDIPDIDWTGGNIWFYGDKPGSGWLAWKRKITSSSSKRVNFNFTTANNLEWIREFHAPADLGDFYLEGVKGALDYQNEWYFEHHTNKLFVMLPNGVKPTDGDVKMRKRAMTIDLKHKKYIQIKNLAVFGGYIGLEDDTRWTTNSRTTHNVLYGITSLYGAHTQGIVEGFNSNHASVLVEGSNNTIERCEIAFGASSGLKVRGNNHLIKNNRIHDFNFLSFYDAPVVLRGMNSSLFIQNTVFNGGRDVINYSGKNNEIAYNDLYKSNLLADDCGLFYTTSPQYTTEIHHNWFHDIASSGNKSKATAIYLDNDAAGFSVHHNVVWNTEWTSIQINWNGTDIDIFNNTLWNGSAVMGAWHKDGTSFSNVRVWNNLGSNSEWEPQSDKQNNMVVDATVFNSTDTGGFNLVNGADPIDKGKIINGITDGYEGSAPDIGAYEYGGDDWSAGITWDYLYGPSGLGCYGLPGEECVNIPENDDDGDGVANAYDNCPDTPSNEVVNASGCPIFTIPVDNFSLLVTSLSCPEIHNGSIQISSKETGYSFTASIEGKGLNNTFSSSTEFTGLSAGDYKVCITVAEIDDFEQCFNVTVGNPKVLKVNHTLNHENNSLSINLEGSSSYWITLNEKILYTEENTVTVDLNHGINKLSIRTDNTCQGTFEDQIVITDSIYIFPVMAKNYLSVVFPTKSNNVLFEIISIEGKLITQSKQQVEFSHDLDISDLNKGVYFIRVTSDKNYFQSKFIKQ